MTNYYAPLQEKGDPGKDKNILSSKICDSWRVLFVLPTPTYSPRNIKLYI
jgi:hypothetical protein